MLFTKSFYALADDTCNCKDLLQRIELLESIIYQNTDNTLDTITPNTLPTSATTPELGIQFVNIGDKTVLDFAEFSLDNIKWTDTLEPSDTSGYYSYYGDKEDEKYVSIWGTIKNLSGEKIYIDEMEIEFKFNGKYSYSGSIILEDNDKKGFTSSFCSVKPLSQSRIIIYTSVPDEIEYSASIDQRNWTDWPSIPHKLPTETAKIDHPFRADCSLTKSCLSWYHEITFPFAGG